MSSFQLFGLVILLVVLLLIPLGLSNHPLWTSLMGLVLVVMFFFSGYLVLAIFDGMSKGLRLLLGPVVGILCLTTTYDVFARFSLGAQFVYLAVVVSATGIVLFALRGFRDLASWSAEDYRTALACSCVALAIAPLFWRSGRFSGGNFVFHGPAGQDHLFHVTLLQRLLQQVPADNFMFAGLRPTIYHYFDDQALALIVSAQQTLLPGVRDLFDLGRSRVQLFAIRSSGSVSVRAIGSERNDSGSGGGFGRITTSRSQTGPQRMKCNCRWFHLDMNRPITCSTCCYRRRSTAKL